MWEGFRAIGEYKKTTSPPLDSCVTLAEELNLFHARLDRDNREPAQPLMPSSDTAPVLGTQELILLMHNIDPRIAAGPDVVLGKVVKHCAGSWQKSSPKSITSRCPQPGFQHALKVR